MEKETMINTVGEDDFPTKGAVKTEMDWRVSLKGINNVCKIV